MTIRPATREDMQAIIDLLGADVPQVSAHTVWQVPWTWQHYLVACDDDTPIAAGSLQPLGDGKAEIRGVVVADQWRGARIGRALVERLIERARTAGLDAVCVTREPEFFRRFGFESTAPLWVDLRRQPVPPLASAEPRFAMALVPASMPESVPC